ncbi:MAG: hypothetical protein ACLP1X_23400 [Polyangiaceae bacterium]|jgi:hypothetical protein
MLQARFVVVREATEVVLRHLERLPPSDTTGQLRGQLQDCLKEVKRWGASPPTDGQGETLMKRVLGLHVEVTRLEHQALVAIVRNSTAAE